jgi:hypothetical protein
LFGLGKRGKVGKNRRKWKDKKTKCLDSTKAVLKYLVWLTRATTMTIGAQVVWDLKRGKIGTQKDQLSAFK